MGNTRYHLISRLRSTTTYNVDNWHISLVFIFQFLYNFTSKILPNKSLSSPFIIVLIFVSYQIRFYLYLKCQMKIYQNKIDQLKLNLDMKSPRNTHILFGNQKICIYFVLKWVQKRYELQFFLKKKLRLESPWPVSVFFLP